MDLIRKKIKGRFLKSLKLSLNEKLKYSNSKQYFDFLPPSFVQSITQNKVNKDALNLNLKELFSKDFSKDYNEKTEINLERYYHNNIVINYLEANEIISEKSNYKYYKNMKYYEIYNEYLNSKEFENDIMKLKEDGKRRKDIDEYYIEQYIKLAFNLNDFFSSD